MTEHDSPKHDEPTLAWIRACLDLSRKKAAALEQSNLTTLDRCLEDEEKLISQRPSLKAAHAFKSLLEELRSLNNKNRALVQSGFEFSRTMLDAIRPPTTYSELAAGQTSMGSHRTESESILSVKC